MTIMGGRCSGFWILIATFNYNGKDSEYTVWYG